tara:strand:+ start:1518 stop:1721 length:204 start_codon:yes stop_codon:yes gene_type:complete
MEKIKYIQLNPVSNIFDENKIWMQRLEPYLDFNSQIRWKTVYIPKKCYLKNIDITNIKDYGFDEFFN